MSNLRDFIFIYCVYFIKIQNKNGFLEEVFELAVIYGFSLTNSGFFKIPRHFQPLKICLTVIIKKMEILVLLCFLYITRSFRKL